MRAWVIRQIFTKEVLSTLRDRRAIISNLLLPLLLLPVLMLGLPLALGGLFSREEAEVTELAVANLDELPAELAAYLDSAGVQPVEHEDPRAAVESEEVTVGLSVPPGFAERLRQGERVDLELFLKVGDLRAEVAASKVQGAVDGYRQSIVAERLAVVGLDPQVLEPLRLQQVDASSPAERSGGLLSWIIPFFIALWTLAGGQMAAIDATAGEKERGTLEALLVTPVRRSEVVVGKFLATLVFGLSAAVMAIVGYLAGGALLTGVFGSSLEGEGAELVAVMGGSLSAGPVAIGLLLGSTVLLSGTIAALLIGITMFARSFKEAQSYVAPLSFLLVLPVLALQFKDLLELGPWVYLIPIANALLLMDDVVNGAYSSLPILLTWGSLIAAIALLLSFALHNFSRENVIFRT